MFKLFASTGMATVAIIILVVEVLSFLVMTVILLAFRRVQRKQQKLFMTLHNAPATLSRHAVLVWTYILLTVGIGLVSLSVFIFQPHIL